MRTFGFAPHILCSVDRSVLPTTGYPYSTLAFYHQPDPYHLLSPTTYTADLNNTIDYRGYMPRFDYSNNNVTSQIGNSLYHCPCNGQHPTLSPTPTTTLLPHLSPFSSSKRYLSEKTRDEPLGEDQRISSIAALRNKAKEFEISNMKVKPEYEERERHVQATG